MLGSVSNRMVRRLVLRGQIRQGKVGCRTVICQRSLRAYLAQCEG